MKLLKRLLLVIAVLFVAIQFIRPARNFASGPSAADITAHYPTSPEVKRILEVSCYDCHSNTTRYPWYANVQPVAWWLADHITEGKKQLNFSEFANYPPKRAANKLEEVVEEITAHEMPLASYTLAHTDARLTPAQSQLVTDWAETIRQRILADNGLAE